MAKYDVKRSCGHEERVDLFGARSERENKIAWMETTVCKECYAKEQNKGCEEVEMTYGEYKNNYADCKTKPNSYDSRAKTIIVYVEPKNEETKSVTDEKKEYYELLDHHEEQLLKALELARGQDEKKATFIKIVNEVIGDCKSKVRNSNGNRAELLDATKLDNIKKDINSRMQEVAR